MPRIARVVVPGYPHHITQRGNNKQIVFFDDEDREFYLNIVAKYSQKWSFEVWAYCLMQNHVHLLVVPKKCESLSKGLGGANLIYTQFMNEKYERSGRLWQNRFFSTVIDKDQYLFAAIRYIEQNPVRASLVDKAEDFVWSSARAHLFNGTNNKLINMSIVSKDGLSCINKLDLGDQRNIDLLRKATSQGRPFGSTKFVRGLEKMLDRKFIYGKAGRPKMDKS